MIRNKFFQPLANLAIFCFSFRNIPDGTGWIMDGFPATVQQAKVSWKLNLIILEAGTRGVL